MRTSVKSAGLGMYKFIIPLFALAFLLVSCGKAPNTTTPTDTSTDTTTSSAAMVPATPKTLTTTNTVTLKTSMGDIEIALDANAAPKTVENFLSLSTSGFYDGLTFHRVMDGFMIQGGDPDGNGSGGSSIFGETFEDEINAQSYGLHNKKLKDAVGTTQLPAELQELTVQQYYEQQGYVYNSTLQSLPMKRGFIAMANRGPNTNGSQFFIIQAEATTWLEGKHTVFGQVTKGMEVVDAIAKVSRDSSDRPITPVTFSVEIKE